MIADWAVLDLSLYEAIVLESLMKSGLLQELQTGTTLPQLKDKGYDLHVTVKVLQSLQAYGWVNDVTTSYVWQGPTAQPEQIHKIDQLRHWLQLGSKLRPCYEESLSSLVTAGELAQLTQTAPALIDWLLDHIQPSIDQSFLDVGGGTGVFSRALVNRCQKVTWADLPQVIDAYHFLATDTLQLWGGNLLQELPQEKYTGIMLLRFVDSLAPEQLVHLLSRLASHLESDGTIYVVSYTSDLSTCAPLFNLQVLLHTEEGRCYSSEELIRLGQLSGLMLKDQVRDAVGEYTLLSFSKAAIT